MKVAIIGGSLGGLAAGIVLRDLGHEVRIYEKSQFVALVEHTGQPFVQAILGPSGHQDGVRPSLPPRRCRLCAQVTYGREHQQSDWQCARPGPRLRQPPR